MSEDVALFVVGLLVGLWAQLTLRIWLDVRRLKKHHGDTPVPLKHLHGSTAKHERRKDADEE